MSFEDFHLELIQNADQEDGVFSYSEEKLTALSARLLEALIDQMPMAVNGFVRAVAAFQASKQQKAAAQLIEVGTCVVEAFRQGNRPAADKLNASVTGAQELLSEMSPIGEPPAGSFKASTLIDPLRKVR